MSLEVYKRRAEETAKIIDSLENRVKTLEKDSVLKNTVLKELRELLPIVESLEKENETLKATIKKLKSGKGGKAAAPSNRSSEDFVRIKQKMEGIRQEAENLEKENESLKKKLSSMGSGSSAGGLSSDGKQHVINELQRLRAKVVALEQSTAQSKPAPAPSAEAKGLKQMTFEGIVDNRFYFVTKDMAELKKAWYEAELGELDDEDFQTYLGRKVKAIDSEEDDETINVRFDNHDTQWFPVSTLYEECAAPAAPACSGTSGSQLVQMTMETLVERKQYFVTKDIVALKKAWYEAELGELDDEDFQSYLGREVKAIDTEEDDDTINVRFDNHDTQWFPVSTLYKKVEGASAPAQSEGQQMTLETVVDNKKYFVTKRLDYLKSEWYKAELGELDDDDFKGYLGREVKALDTEEDDETVNVRFDNHDTQWFPVSVLFKR